MHRHGHTLPTLTIFLKNSRVINRQIGSHAKQDSSGRHCRMRRYRAVSRVFTALSYAVARLINRAALATRLRCSQQ